MLEVERLMSPMARNGSRWERLLLEAEGWACTPWDDWGYGDVAELRLMSAAKGSVD